MAQQARILVIGNDPNFLEYVGTVLGPRRYEVYTVENASEGPAAMRRVKPQLVLMDLMMSSTLDGDIMTSEKRSDPELRKIPLIKIVAIGNHRGRGPSTLMNSSTLISASQVMDGQDSRS
jgi:CheY-like chemotaxis protein